MTPQAWTILALAAVPAVLLCIAWLWAAMIAAGEADDRADATLERMRGENISEAEAAMRQMRGGDGGGMLWS